MARSIDYSDLSELERDVELDMEGEFESIEDFETVGPEVAFETAESDDEGVSGNVFELDEEASLDPEVGQEVSFEVASDHPDNRYVERLLEIASREYETESEVDQALNGVLNDVATEYLFGSVWQRAKKFGNKLAKNKIIGSLVKKGLAVASGQFPALQAALQLSKGNLQGALLNLGKQALGAAVPGGPAVLGGLKALGIQPLSEVTDDRETWENFVQVSRDAFEYLGDNLTELADQPIEASKLAAQAFQHALGQAQSRTSSGRPATRKRDAGAAGSVTRIRIRPGDRLLISGAHNLLIKGL